MAFAPPKARLQHASRCAAWSRCCHHWRDTAAHVNPADACAVRNRCNPHLQHRRRNFHHRSTSSPSPVSDSALRSADAALEESTHVPSRWAVIRRISLPLVAPAIIRRHLARRRQSARTSRIAGDLVGLRHLVEKASARGKSPFLMAPTVGRRPRYTPGPAY